MNPQNGMDITAIIPIYNTPVDALRKCLDSITFSPEIKFEVLLVDDGSEFDVGEFCRNYAERYSNFRYIHKSNGGVSSARNLGIREACGEYIVFIDSDDTYIPVENMAALIKKNCDVIIFDILQTLNGRTQRLYAFCQQEGFVSKEDCCKRAVTTSSLNSACAKLFRRQMLLNNGVQFDETMISGEDLCFVLDTLRVCARIYYEPTVCYNYLIDYATYVNRSLRSPERVLENIDTMHEKKLRLIQRCDFPNQTKQEFYTALIAEKIELIFNTAADLAAAKVFTQARKAELGKRVDGIPQLQIPNTKTRMKYTILCRRQWWLLQILALMRVVYLHVKTK